jgi:nucleoside-diphosphate-sugar epimerase
VLAVRFPFTAAWDDLRKHSDQLADDPESGVREGWTYLDVRDAARVVELGLTRPLSGFEAVFVCADDTAAPYATEDLLDAYAPQVPRRRRLPGREAPADHERARRLLGFRAAHQLDLPIKRLPSTVSPDRA